MPSLLGFIVIGITIAIYFAPSIVAFKRRHQNATPILILNLFFGITIIGWVLVLAWAFSNQRAN